MDKSEFDTVVAAHNARVKDNEMLKVELENEREIISRLKEKISEMSMNVNESNLSNAMGQPIIDTVNWDTDLKWFVLATNRAETNPEYKDRAMDFLYKYVEKETGQNIKELINKSLEDKKAAIAGDTWAEWKMITTKKTDPSFADDVISRALA